MSDKESCPTDANIKPKTTIIIAHRLSTVTGADCIYVLDKGRIVEQGTHQQLIETEGTYQRLWNIQTGKI